MGAESLFSRVKDMVSHVVDSFIPIAEDEDEEEEIRAQQASQTAQTTQAAQSFASERRVANGGTVSSFSSPSYGSTSSFQAPRTPVTGEGSSTPLRRRYRNCACGFIARVVTMMRLRRLSS